MKRLLLVTWLSLGFHSLLLIQVFTSFNNNSVTFSDPQTLGASQLQTESPPKNIQELPTFEITPSDETVRESTEVIVEIEIEEAQETKTQSEDLIEDVSETEEVEVEESVENNETPDKTIPESEEVEPEQEIIASSLWDVIQNWRENNGKSRYASSSAICDLAAVRGEKALGNPDNPHTGFEEDTSSFFEAYCGGSCQAAENVVRGFDSPQGALDAWLDSDGHRGNLEADYTYSCIRDYGDTAIQVFANY